MEHYLGDIGMSEKRLKEIDIKIAELEALKDPFWNKQHALEKEKEKIYTNKVREIARAQEWTLHYDERREKVYLELKEHNKKVSDEIYKYADGFYHHSFTIEGKKDNPFEEVKLSINDGEVQVWFSNTDMFKQYASKFNIDPSNITKIKKDLLEKIVTLESLEYQVWSSLQR